MSKYSNDQGKMHDIPYQLVLLVVVHTLYIAGLLSNAIILKEKQTALHQRCTDVLPAALSNVGADLHTYHHAKLSCAWRISDFIMYKCEIIDHTCYIKQCFS